MENLSIDDTRHLHHGIQQLYTLKDLDTFGVDALTIVDRLIPSDLPVFNLTSARTGQILLEYLPSFDPVAPELLQGLTQVLLKDPHQHPLVENMPQTLHGVYKFQIL
jgi:hypothetical protein